MLLKHAFNINHIAERGQSFQVRASDMFRLVRVVMGYCKPKNTFQDLQNQEKTTVKTGISTLELFTVHQTLNMSILAIKLTVLEHLSVHVRKY